MYVGDAIGVFEGDSRDVVVNMFNDHIMHWLHLHNFSRGTAQSIVNSLKSCIVAEGEVAGYIVKNTKDIIPHKKKHRHRYIEKIEDPKDQDSPNEFAIKISYIMHLTTQTERTFRALFVPCIYFFSGWEPLLDKEYKLRYKVSISRLRGRQEYKIKSNYFNKIENDLPRDEEAEQKKKTIGDTIIDFFKAFKSDEKKDKKDKKDKKKHKKHHRRRKHHSGSSSSDSDSSDGDSDSHSSHDHYEERPEVQPPPQQQVVHQPKLPNEEKKDPQ